MLWFKALHLIFMVCWFAGIFYLPRLFVYHAESNDAISNARFKLMERRLYRGIMMPSMVLTILFGLGILHSVGLSAYKQQIWLHIKLLLVFLLVIYHFYCGYLLKLFNKDLNSFSPFFYRILNEVPVIMLIGIILLAVLRPF